MNEEQQKVVEKEVTGYQEQCFHGMIDDMLYSCLDKLRAEDLLPELETPDGPNPEVRKLMVEIEKLAARTVIQEAVKYLQNRQEAFPKSASPKLAIVEIEYSDKDRDEDEVFEAIVVDKVLLNGKEVNRPGCDEYWPILHIGGDYLDLQLSSD